MAPLNITQNGQNALLSWTAPTANGAAVNKITISLLSWIVGQNYQEYSVAGDCDGTNIAITSCEIPMSYFITTLGYQPGQ